MSEANRMLSGDSAVSSNGYLRGDRNPSNFSYENVLTHSELLTLFLRNGKVQKATEWFANEMIRERWEFKVDKAVISTKFGKAYTFDSYMEWFEWIGYFQELLKALTWSLLFGEAIIVFYDGNEGDAELIGDKRYLKHKEGHSYIKCKAFYDARAKNNGYFIEEVDPFFGEVIKYRINLQMDKAKKNVQYYVDSGRVVRFSAPQKELKYSGSSTVSTIAKDCIVQEQIKRAVYTQMNNLMAGIIAMKAANEEEMEILEDTLGSVNHLNKVYVKNIEDVEKAFKLLIPDFKLTQLKELNDIIQTDISTGISMSKSNLEGAPQGALSSAKYDTLNTYTKVKQLQSHYKHAIEECFFKLGKENTDFEWNDPTEIFNDSVDVAKPKEDNDTFESFSSLQNTIGDGK